MQDTNVLHMPPHCAIRRQEEQYLIYNSRTDELCLVPPLGFYILSLCNGILTVGELVELLSCHFNENETQVKNKLLDYINSLVQRGILEVDTSSADYV